MLYRVPIPYTTDAASYYAAISDLPWAVWLDSAGLGRFDILCALPEATLVVHGSETEICDSNGKRCLRDDPFTLLRQQLGKHEPATPDIPFYGGALGYWAYNLSRRILQLPASEASAEQLPDMAVGIYDWAIVLDHQEKSAQLVSVLRFTATKNILPEILNRLQHADGLPSDTFKLESTITSNFTLETYSAAFTRIQNYLLAGDSYQINLAQQFSAAASGDALGAYFKLRSLNPAPYSAFLNLPHAQILCASPERFLRVQQGHVQTKPIKGTRPRSPDRQRDAQLADDLRNHPKDRAENLIIVDLLRNDLGKTCIPGSIRVPKLFEIESFATVHHLVSTVEGTLCMGRDALHVLRDSFPGGSITGAPKLRAMQIIDQLEPSSRGLYCGTIGYVGFDGYMDTNIVIRTLVYSNNTIRCWAGGGIVADSELKLEYQETFDKASGMLNLLNHYQRL